MKKRLSFILLMCCHTAFAQNVDFGLQALYLQPDIDAINFRGTRVLSNGDIQYVNYNPQYAWGFKAEGAYHINSDYDINLNVYHVEKTNNRVFGNITGNEDSVLSSAKGSITPNWDAVNLELGQQLARNSTNVMRIHAGLQYAHITLDESSSVFISDSGTLIPSKKTITRTYNGVGPRLGADLGYNWVSGFGIYSNLATALLSGTRSSNTQYSLDAQLPSRFNSSMAIVPELEAKLGTEYNHSFGQSKIVLTAGWMWINYFKAAFNDNYNLSLSTPVPMEHTSTSFALSGPFFGAKWISG